MKNPKYEDEVPLARRLSSVSLDNVLQVVADHYRVDPACFAVKHSNESSRDVAAWLARRVTTATLREWSFPFGLSHPDSVRNLIRPAEQAMEKSRTFRKEVD